MPQHKINPDRYSEPTLPELDKFDAIADYRAIALKFGASIIPATDTTTVPPLVAARQEELHSAFVREIAQPSALDFGAKILVNKALASCQICPFMVSGECITLDGLDPVADRRTIGGKKYTTSLAKTGTYGHKLTESLMQKRLTHSTLRDVPPACPLATLLETYKPRPVAVPAEVQHLARIAGIALAQQHFCFYGESFDSTLRAGATLLVRDTVYTSSDVTTLNPEINSGQDMLPIAV